MESPFTPEQIAELKKTLDKNRVKHRAGGGGMQLAYLRGTDVIDRANEIFGYGQWGFDLLETGLQSVYGDGGEIIGGYYFARVRLTVAGCIPITEEGINPIQEGRNPRAKIDAHDMARKGAITDAMKRALRCFGDQFGNSLYDTDLVDGQPKGDNSQQQQTRQQPANPAPGRPATQQPAPTVNRPAQAPAAPQQPAKPPQPVTAPTSPIPVSNGKVYEPATEIQKQAIQKMAKNKGWDEQDLRKRLFDLYGTPLDALPKSDAGHFIQVLQDKAV